MKSLRQFREDNEISLSSDTLNEAITKKRPPVKGGLPKMPSMLLFKRITYRIYPDNQLVALYYSRMIDKYLTIPFSKEGIPQISESIIYNNIEDLNEDWQSVNRKDRTDGLSQKAVDAYKRENPGSNLQTAVTEKNPKGKRAARRKSFCARMGGMKARLTSAKTARDPDSRINKALRRWNCEESFREKLEEKRQERVDESLPIAIAGNIARSAAGGAVSSIARRGVGKTIERAITKVGGKGGLKAYRGLKKGLGAAAAGDAASKEDSSENKSKTLRTGDIQAKQVNVSSSLARSSQKTQSVQENKISDIRKIIKENNSMNMIINGKSITLNNTMAKRIVELYDSVNVKNKRIIENMLNEDLESYKRLLNFTIRN